MSLHGERHLPRPWAITPPGGKEAPGGELPGDAFPGGELPGDTLPDGDGARSALWKAESLVFSILWETKSQDLSTLRLVE